MITIPLWALLLVGPVGYFVSAFISASLQHRQDMELVNELIQKLVDARRENIERKLNP